MSKGARRPISRHHRRVGAPIELRMSRTKRLTLVGEGAIVGLAAGLTITLYRFLLSHAEGLLRSITSYLAHMGPILLLWFVVLAALCIAVGRLVLLEPFTQGSGIPQLDAEVAGRIDMPWARVLPTKMVEGILCAFAGLSLGREGPSVLLGGMVGKGVSRGFGERRNRERYLVTCGAAAGMSAAFHSPLTGVLFAVEEIHKEFSAPLVISAMTSSVVADYVSSHLLGVEPLIHFVSFSSIPHRLYPAVLLMGLLCGLLGAAHNKGMFWVQDSLFGRLEGKSIYVRLAIPFLLAGVSAFLFPDLMCGGDAIIERVLNAPSQTMGVLLALLVGKYVFTSICFGSGAPGGTLLPLVVMGALVGAIYGMGAMHVAHVPGVYENSFIVLGIAGMFSGVIQAPVTGVVLVFELTGSLEALLATSLVSIMAYVVSSLVGAEPFYEHLYGRLIGRQDADESRQAADGDKLVRTYVVSPGSAIEGRTIRDVAWPEGVLVVTVRRGDIEEVAKGDSRIKALDELTVVFGATGEDRTHTALRSLCAPAASG
ncbi:MAG: ClC family H(+)/Cl(-) exchange transporter [Coriobacteriales bacterium]|nr:ClC family H(+)/Cl(-) exchange transporter [Coriobacteriales bacterium]